ncbi:Spo11/DNA topoisomerase VI subunit A [Kalaharituber pfeilii]|nr:Spo11/DNA topoisomerase VI subunit A [Kalaharituber pfeilii]
MVHQSAFVAIDEGGDEMDLLRWWDEVGSSQQGIEVTNQSLPTSSIEMDSPLELHEGGSVLQQLSSKSSAPGAWRSVAGIDTQSAVVTIGQQFNDIGEGTRECVLRHVEGIFNSLLNTILQDEKRELAIEMKIRKSKNCQRFDPLTKLIRSTMQCSTRNLVFPGRNLNEAHRFATFLRVLSFILEALSENKITTKRDIYYKDVKLFRKQTVVDTIVDNIAYTLGVERGKLNVVAAAKGLISGCLRIWYKSGEVIECWRDREGVLIPRIKLVGRVDILDAKWVLVVEKEATFRALAANRFWETCTAGRGILLTGKGYPDITTRELLCRISNAIPLLTSPLSERTNFKPAHGLPMYAVVDYDPHGLDILSVYKFGSIALAHENHRLVANRVQLLGIKSEDLGAINSHSVKDSQKIDMSILRLTECDRRKAIQLLSKIYVWLELEWRRELQRMLFLNVKAEIQAIGHNGNGNLESHLNQKLGMLCSE